MFNWGKDTRQVYETTNNISLNSALVILSGGMDSATCLALICSKVKKVHAITFEYGQKHSKETQDAQNIAKHFNVGCTVITLPGLADYFNTALSKTSDIAIPETHEGGVPPTYVPFRNTIMLSIAAGYAESWGYEAVVYGANAVDYSGYPDCRPNYIDAMNNVIAIHTDKIQIFAPIVNLTKSDIVRLGNKYKVPWELTWSCYRGGDKACGKCPSCQYRLMGFEGAGLKDPIPYQ